MPIDLNAIRARPQPPVGEADGRRRKRRLEKKLWYRRRAVHFPGPGERHRDRLMRPHHRRVQHLACLLEDFIYEVLVKERVGNRAELARVIEYVKEAERSLLGLEGLVDALTRTLGLLDRQIEVGRRLSGRTDGSRSTLLYWHRQVADSVVPLTTFFRAPILLRPRLSARFPRTPERRPSGARRRHAAKARAVEERIRAQQATRVDSEGGR